MKNQYKILFFAFVLFTSCVKDTYNNPENQTCVDAKLSKTKEVKAIYNMAKATTSTYAEDDIIEAYVISSDEGGNFYKSMYLQPTDGSRGFNLSVDESNLYTKNFQAGKKVYIKLKGLSFANPTGNSARGLVFGAAPTSDFAVDRIPSIEYKNYLFPSCETINEDQIAHKISFDEANKAQYLNTLVEFDNVQFVDEYSGGTFDTNRLDNFDSSIFITDGTKKFIVRTSRYASLASLMVPSGKGKIRGVLTKFNTLNQIILRTVNDVNMPDVRVDYILPLVGNTIDYFPTFIEDFESYTVTTKGAFFPKYVNDAFIGSRYWDVKSYAKNKYIQMTSYASGGNNKTYLLLPVDFVPGNKFSFKTKDANYNGDVIKVYYTTNYDPTESISKATLTDITSRFVIANGTLSGYAKTFTESGQYIFPKTLTGNGFIVFEYSGTVYKTTTIQIDDVLVEE